MARPTLDLGALVNAVARLDEGLVRHRLQAHDAQLRDGLIQRFEFTYEISHKMLKRYLEMAAPTPEQYDGMSFQDLIRSGNEQGLLRSDWPRWRAFREMRSRTSHTYDETVALEVVAGIPDFLLEARHLLDTLEARLA